MNLRIGHGIDTHRIAPGEGMSLGGVSIPCAWRIIAHSDGDVLIHALCDALLGAIGEGDIGKHFPDTDARYKGISSQVLLKEVMARVNARNWRVINADLSLLAEVPRVAPHVQQMSQVLAALLAVEAGCVNVKATTNEGMGYVGRKEGITAHAVVLLQAD